MDLKQSSIAGLAGMLTAVLLLWLMGVNLVGWLGVWLTPGAAWIVGTLITIGLAFGFAALWTGVVAKQDGVKKLPKPAAGAVYGVIVALIMIFLVPLILSALAGDPPVGLASGTFLDGLGEAFGGHMVPPLPDLGFDPPLSALAKEEWFRRDDFVGRLLPFGIAFTAFGVVVALLNKSGK